MILVSAHNHEPVVNESATFEIKASLKRKAMTQPLTPTQNIVSESLCENFDVDHLLPYRASLDQIVRRARPSHDVTPCNSKSDRSTYILPESCKVTKDKKIVFIFRHG